MPARVDVIHRRVVDVGVAVQSLHPRRDDAIRLGEASQGGVVPAGVVEHQAEICGVAELTRISILRQRRSTLVADFSPHLILGLRDEIPILVRITGDWSLDIVPQLRSGDGVTQRVSAFSGMRSWRLRIALNFYER